MTTNCSKETQMKFHRYVVAAMTAGMIVAHASAAHAIGWCIWCDDSGCHIAPSCPPPPPPPPPPAAGTLCAFVSSDDSTGTLANPGTQVGELDGGPLVLASTP